MTKQYLTGQKLGSDTIYWIKVVKTQKNCGQIAKDYLLSREKNVFLFTFAGKDESKEVIRRKLKRVAGTAVPCEVLEK